MSLAKELGETFDGFQKTAPQEVFDTIGSTMQGLIKSFDPSKVVQVGQQFPAFELLDATGKTVSKDALLSEGALLIFFYRGDWCPFCNLELRALQKRLPDFQAKGVSLVAISPQLPDSSLSMAEKKGLEYKVLSDVDNKLAKQLGLMWAHPDSFRPILAQVDWQKTYGNDNLEVPIPASFLVDKNGIVRNTFVDPNWTKRLEPETALEWAAKLWCP